MSTPLCVDIRFQLKPGLEDAFLAEIMAFGRVVAAEPECLEFRIYREDAEGRRVRVSETWTSREHFDTVQMAKPYYAPYFEKVRPMWAAPIEKSFWTPVAQHGRNAP